MTSKLLAALLAAGLSLGATTSQAALYSFYQGGFDEGASISGTFEANDLNNDGQIKVGNSAWLPGYDFNEITSFTLSFSGNSLVPAFSQTLTDLTALIYNVGSPYLGDQISPIQEGIGTDFGQITGFDYYSGMGFGGFGGAVTDQSTSAISYSGELVQVSAVPVPAPVWLLGSALAGCIRLARRQKAMDA